MTTFWHSIKFKLGALITFLVVSTVLVVSIYLLRQEQTSLAQEMSKRGWTIARDMAASAKNPLLTDDQLTLNLLAKDAMRDEDVVYVIFADDKDTVLAHSDVSLSIRIDGCWGMGSSSLREPRAWPGDAHRGQGATHRMTRRTMFRKAFRARSTAQTLSAHCEARGP